MFDLFKDNEGNVCVNQFLNDLKHTGLKRNDPRFVKVIDNLYSLSREKGQTGIENLSLNSEQFERVIQDNVLIICKALQREFVLPDFTEFCKHIEEFYVNCKSNKSGHVAEYIPQLAKVNPEYWGVSICTVDGQRFSMGDTRIPFTIQSTGKPINYAIALSELGAEVVHKYVGQEPSGRMFNELVLDQNKKPHNPMVNAGAIVVCSLLLNLIEVMFFSWFTLMTSSKFNMLFAVHRPTWPYLKSSNGFVTIIRRCREMNIWALAMPPSYQRRKQQIVIMPLHTISRNTNVFQITQPLKILWTFTFK